MGMKNLTKTILLLVLLGRSIGRGTGHSQSGPVSDGQMVSWCQGSYQQFLSQNKLSTNAEKRALLKWVGQRIAAAAKQYLIQENCLKNIEGFNWEFNLIDSKELNAWCMPEGKVVVTL